MKEYNFQEKVINEITEMIGNNIKLYLNLSDEYFNRLRNFCKKNYNKGTYVPTSYNTLLLLTEEVLSELFNCYHLYDLRSLE